MKSGSENDGVRSAPSASQCRVRPVADHQVVGVGVGLGGRDRGPAYLWIVSGLSVGGVAPAMSASVKRSA